MSLDGANSIQIAPVNVFWRIEAREQIAISQSAPALDGKYFRLGDVSGNTYTVVWFDLDSGSTPPVLGPNDSRLLEVDIITGDGPSDIATKLVAALDGDAAYNSALNSDGNVDVKRVEFATVLEIAEGDVGFETGFTLTQCRFGQNYDLGLIQGDISESLAPAVLDVTTQQNGLTPVLALLQGIETAEVSTTLLETQYAKIQEIYKLYGGEITGQDSSSIFGLGTSKQGQNLLPFAARLELVPVNETDSANAAFLTLAIPVPNELVFSGENPRTLAVTWRGYADELAPPEVSVAGFGDPSQFPFP